MTFNVEAFINGQQFPVLLSGEDGDENRMCMEVEAVRTLVAQLVPAGHVVVPRSALESVLEFTRVNSLNMLKSEEEADKLLRSLLSTLPASSGPEQPKCGCVLEYPPCTAGFTEGHSVNPEYCCTPRNGLVCGHDRACHTPAPAAKEVMHD